MMQAATNKAIGAEAGRLPHASHEYGLVLQIGHGGLAKREGIFRLLFMHWVFFMRWFVKFIPYDKPGVK